MKIVFIRHGEYDKVQVDIRQFIGMGRELAPLSAVGEKQAEKVSESPILLDSEIILSSPYTRALQTAATISRKTNLPLKVEIDLHELIFDKTYSVNNPQDDKLLYEDFKLYKGEHTIESDKRWESISEIIARTKPVFDKYYNLGYKKIIVVSHGGVIRRYIGHCDVDYCEIFEVEYDNSFECYGWL